MRVWLRPPHEGIELDGRLFSQGYLCGWMAFVICFSRLGHVQALISFKILHYIVNLIH